MTRIDGIFHAHYALDHSAKVVFMDVIVNSAAANLRFLLWPLRDSCELQNDRSSQNFHNLSQE